MPLTVGVSFITEHLMFVCLSCFLLDLSLVKVGAWFMIIVIIIIVIIIIMIMSILCRSFLGIFSLQLIFHASIFFLFNFKFCVF